MYNHGLIYSEKSYVFERASDSNTHAIKMQASIVTWKFIAIGISPMPTDLHTTCLNHFFKVLRDLFRNINSKGSSRPISHCNDGTRLGNRLGGGNI